MIATWKHIEDFIQGLPHLQDGGRGISSLVLHHTYDPDHASFDGEKSIRGIERYWRSETKKKGWEHPLGAHFIVAPEGVIYQTFGLDVPVNADSQLTVNQHGIAVEAVGNFDTGHDLLEGSQLHAVAGLFGALMVRYRLGPQDVHFHSDYQSYKSCPGSGLSKGWFRQRAAAGKAWAAALYPK